MSFSRLIMINTRYFLAFFWVLPLLFLTGCEQNQTESYTPTYSTHSVASTRTLVLGVHPLFNPEKLFRVFTPLADYLSNHLSGINVIVEASKDYATYDQKLKQRKFDLVLPNPYQTIVSMDYQYNVIAQAGDNELFKGIILLRKDSPIKHISDLKGKTISYPAPTALAATMMPQLFLFDHGLDIQHETQTLYVGSQESSMMNAYLKLSDAAATWPLPWEQLQIEKPEVAQQLKLAWQTETLPNNSFMYHTNTVKANLGNKIQALLIDLIHTPEGEQILHDIGISKFYPASNENYEPVKKFLSRFQAKIGDNAAFNE